MKFNLKNIFAGEYRNIRLFYVMQASMNSWFIISNWIYFWTRFMTYGQVGWLDALGYGFALLLEIPSGAIADLLGKKRTLQIAFIAGAVGTLLVATTQSFAQLFIGWMIAQIAYAFYSGAAEALAYDTLVDLKREKQYDKVVTRGESAIMYAATAATLIGGFVYEVNYRLPQILWSASFFVGLIASFFLIEPNTDTQKFSWTTYTAQLRDGVKELFNKDIRRYTIFFIILSGVYYMYIAGLIRPAIATSFGLFSREQAVMLPILSFFGAMAINIVPKLRTRISDFTGLTCLSVLMALGFIFSALPIGYYGIILMIMISIAGDFSRPWLSIVVNQHIPSKYRATTLSTAALINRIPYVLVAVTAGKMIEEGKLGQFDIGIGVFIMIGLAISLGVMLAHVLSGRISKPLLHQEIVD